jgi:hypothetical protein
MMVCLQFIQWSATGFVNTVEFNRLDGEEEAMNHKMTMVGLRCCAVKYGAVKREM